MQLHWIREGLGVGGDPYLKGLKGDRIRTVCVCLHIKSLYESGKRDKQAHKCTAAIKHYFTVAGLSVEFLGTMHAPNHMIRTARGATKSSADELRIAGQRRVATVKLPVFRELMDLLQEQLWEGKGWGWKDIDSRMVFMGVWWGYDLCVRVGEYTLASATDVDHCTRANELTFVLVNPLIVDGRSVGSVVGGSHLMTLVKFLDLEYCLVGATSHKGGSLVKRKFIGKSTEAEDQSLFRLWQWMRCSGVRPEDELFTRYSSNLRKRVPETTRKVLCRSTVVAAIKRAADLLGFDKDYFSSHSLRKGGRSDMSGAGVSEEQMNERGNYKEGSKVGRSVYDYSSRGHGAYSSRALGGSQLVAKDIRVLIPVV